MQLADYTLQVPQGRFLLHRWPKRRREMLRAWDAADEYLLHYLAEQPDAVDTGRLLIVNDGFGALAVVLAAWQPQVWSDSYLSQTATGLNLVANDIAPEQVSLLNSQQLPSGPLDRVLIKAPKTLALLEDQLIRLRPLLSPSTQVVVAGMVKGLPSSVWSMLERLLGPTETPLAHKKAKIILIRPDPALPLPTNPYPVRYALEDTPYTVSNHANVFSRDSLDIGTRFLLQHLQVLPEARDIVDLGCGNGVLGLMAADKHSKAKLHFVDESFMAVASARENFHAAFGEGRAAEFQVADGLSDFAPASADLVLCNPPFHQQQTVGDQLAQRMFQDARRALRPGGELWVVSNRHLGYHIALKRLFGGAEVMASNVKFVVLRSIR